MCHDCDDIIPLQLPHLGSLQPHRLTVLQLMSIITFEWPKRFLFVRAILVVTGGFLVHLSLGTIYTFGNIAPYIVSFLHNQSHAENLRPETASWIFACSLVGQGGAMFAGGWMVKKIGPRLTTLIGGWVMSLGVCLSYFTIKFSFELLLVTYGLVFGVGIGIAYIGPLSSAMSWMPKWKGFANGVVLAGFGLGALIFNTVQTAFVNPHNLGTVKNANGMEYFTDPELLDRIPVLFLVLGGTYAVLQLVGSLLLTNPPEDYNTIKDESGRSNPQEQLFKSGLYCEIDDNSNSKIPTLKRPMVGTTSINRLESTDPQLHSLVDNQDSCCEGSHEQDTELLLDKEESTHPFPNTSSPARMAIMEVSVSSSVTAWSKKNVVASLKPLQVLKKPSFYLLWYMFLANGLSTTVIATLYKFFGLSFISDDHFLTSVGSVAAIFNCSGRIIWGLIADKISYKFALVVLSGVMTIFTLTLYASTEGGKAMFFIWVCIIFFCIGGNYSLFPTAVGRAFGLKYVSVNYGLLFTSQIVAGSVGALLSSVLKACIGYDGLLFLVSGFSFSAFILAILYKPKRYISLQPK